MEGEKPPDSGWLRRLARFFGAAPRDADDVAQNTLERWCTSRGDVDLANLEAWIYKVAQNEAREARRRERTRREVLMPPDEVADVGGESEDDPEAAAIQASDLAAARRLVQAIHPSRRAIYLEHRVGEMSAPELAAERGIPVETVRTRLKLAAADIRAARARSAAAKRGRSSFVLPILGDLLGGARRGLGASRAAAWKLAALVCSAAVVAGLLLAIPRWTPRLSPGPLLLRLPAARLALPALGCIGTQPAAGPTVNSIAPPPVVHAYRPASMRRGAGPHERSLIRRARAAMEGGDPAFARSLLADHARQFPRGPLAGEREALLRALMN